MIRNRALLWMFFGSLCAPQLALAQVTITEIMYDPAGSDSGREWIEIFNAAPVPVDLSKWKLVANGASHNVVKTSEQVVGPGSYAIIAANAAKFSSDYPQYAGALFHSSFSLDNSGATIALKDASSTVVESLTYDSAAGGAGDGNSLGRLPSDSAPLSARAPSPGSSVSEAIVPPKEKPAASAASTKKQARAKSRAPTPAASPAAVARTGGAISAGTPRMTAQTAAVADAARMPEWYWWAALAAICVPAMGAIAAAKHFKKDEWEIIEERDEAEPVEGG